MFSLPKEIRALIAAEKRVMTVDNPLFMQESSINAGVFENNAQPAEEAKQD